jgi:hypothetical protein
MSLLPLYKYLFKFVRGTILLLVFEQSIHTFFAMNLLQNNFEDKEYSEDHTDIQHLLYLLN